MRQKMTMHSLVMAAIASCLMHVPALAKMTLSNIGQSHASRLDANGHMQSNPYVTNGLAAMYDCKWNAGIGVQPKQQPTTWVDLAGNNDIELVAGSLDSNGYDMSIVTYIPFNEAMGEATIELVIDAWQLANDSRFFSLVDSGISLGRYNNMLICSKRSIWNRTQFEMLQPYPKCISIAYMPSKDKIAFFDGAQPNKLSEMWTIIGTSSYIGNRSCYGRIKCIRIYDRALSEEEILFNYSIDKERFGL